jgi:porin
MAWLASALAMLPAAPALAGSPPSVSVLYTGDLIGDAAGGEQRGADWISRLDLAVATGDRLFGIDGAHAQADVMLLHGGGFSADRSGDAQVASNIDAPHAIRPYEAWIEAPLAPHWRAKAGLVDLNSEFDLQAVGALFLNSSFGIGPDFSQSGPNGPSIFPVTAPGMLVAYEPPGWSVRLGVFDALAGDPDHPHRTLPDSFRRDGALLVVEGNTLIGPLLQAQFGLWTYTDRASRLDAPGKGQSAGGYAQIEARIAGGGQARALRGWIRVGRATDAVNPIGTYVGGGLTWGDDGTVIGAAVARAVLGDPARRAGSAGDALPHRAETALEFTGRRRVARGLFLQPDLQYILHPGWTAGVADALVLALRVQWNWLVGR